VGLLLANVKMTIRSQPVSLAPQESLSGFCARRSAMLIVPRRVFVRKYLKPRKVKVAGLIAGRPVPCNRLPSKRRNTW
jgi:hypothetical protein